MRCSGGYATPASWGEKIKSGKENWSEHIAESLFEDRPWKSIGQRANSLSYVSKPVSLRESTLADFLIASEISIWAASLGCAPCLVKLPGESILHYFQYNARNSSATFHPDTLSPLEQQMQSSSASV